MAFGLKTMVTCPKCRESFEYTFVPGGSLRAIRLGPYRYTRCQKCGRLATFDIAKNLDPRIKRMLLISQAVAGVALGMLGVIFLLIAGRYPAASEGHSALQISAAIFFLLAAIILALLYAYRRR